MSKKNDGGHAFPVSDCMGGRGMSLRDYFAAKAMQAAATNVVGAEGFTFEQRAAWSYQQADAMIEERAK